MDFINRATSSVYFDGTSAIVFLIPENLKIDFKIIYLYYDVSMKSYNVSLSDGLCTAAILDFVNKPTS